MSFETFTTTNIFYDVFVFEYTLYHILAYNFAILMHYDHDSMVNYI